MAAVVLISLFIVAALNSLRRVLVEINRHQALFRRMWDNDRAAEARQRQEDAAQRAADEQDHRQFLADTITFGLQQYQDRPAAGGGGARGEPGAGAGASDDGNRDSSPSLSPSPPPATNIHIRMAQAQAAINALRDGGPTDPEEREQWMRVAVAAVREEFADVLPGAFDEEADWEVDDDDDDEDQEDDDVDY